MTNLPDATWTEVDRAPRRAVLVPLGSLEQHGPHLPLDTDTRIAVAVATAAAAQREGVAVAPPLAFGASGEHDAFPGTVSIGTDALTKVLVELGRDVSRHWDALLIVNAHGGNQDAVGAGLARLTAEGRRCGAYSVAPRTGDAHAGRTETSLLLHLDPAAVRGEKAEPGETRPIAQLIGRLRSDGVRSLSPNGVLGDPAGATAEEGRRLLDQATADCVAALDELLAAGSAR
ncbi:MAG TPA: mycofactocin biosynthesis peptidyl-dipeptidase MftE [Solirubrobacteraceae bacterium]|nr:mycofactocin biosynthesis peptidyl-dipeptidase MftE [Solirubrobacteraceae bacterium]